MMSIMKLSAPKATMARACACGEGSASCRGSNMIPPYGCIVLRLAIRAPGATRSRAPRTMSPPGSAATPSQSVMVLPLPCFMCDPFLLSSCSRETTKSDDTRLCVDVSSTCNWVIGNRVSPHASRKCFLADVFYVFVGIRLRFVAIRGLPPEGRGKRKRQPRWPAANRITFRIRCGIVQTAASTSPPRRAAPQRHGGG